MRVLLATDRPDLGHALSLFLSERSIHVVDVVDDFDRLMDRAATRARTSSSSTGASVRRCPARLVADLMDRDDPTPVIVLSTRRTGRERARAARRPTRRSATTPDSLLATLLEAAPHRQKPR